MKTREALVNLFTECNTLKSLTQLHSQSLKSGFSKDSFFATKLTSLYSKHNSVNNAHKVFDETPHRTIYLWNATLRSFIAENQYEETLSLFRKMFCEEKPDSFTVCIALKACAGLRALLYGEIVHGFVKRNGKIASDMFVAAGLIKMYAKCGKMCDAVRVLEEFNDPDVFMWTSVVSGYEKNRNAVEALEFLSRMVTVGKLRPERVTLITAVSACAQLSNLRLGRCVHGVAIKDGLTSDLCLVNSLLNLYAKTGCVGIAARLFWKMQEKDVISWSSMIACYIHNGAALKALDLFNKMINSGVAPNSVTVTNALQACSVACNLEEGRKIHEIATRKGFELDVAVATALIDMYMKCSETRVAIDLFDRMPEKDVVSWAVLLSGYAQNGMAYKSMGVFCNMLSHETRPDAVAVVKILAACSELGNLQQALCLHAYAIKSSFDDNIFVGASLIELYAKCGSIGDAIQLFEGIMYKDVVIWSAMIAGYGINGQGEEALKLFDHMVKHSAVKPDDVTFTSVLSACSHAGLIERGLEIFNMMLHEYQMKPGPKHYGILVDLLGRGGELNKAMDIVELMPNPAASHVWAALFGACRIHNNIKLGEVVAKRLLELDPDHPGYYVLLSNMYAMDDKWENVSNLRTFVKGKGLKKIFGHSVVN